MTNETRYALTRIGARPGRSLDGEAFCRASGLHPALVERLVALGLLEPQRDAAGRLWFAPDQLVVVARIQRLRAGLSLNYAALGLVLDLLQRIAELEAATRRRDGWRGDPAGRAHRPTTQGGEGTWTRTG
jgi:hypothetical protein